MSIRIISFKRYDPNHHHPVRVINSGLDSLSLEKLYKTYKGGGLPVTIPTCY